MEVYKRLHVAYDDEFPWLELAGPGRTRGHQYKLRKVFKRSAVKRKTFSVRVVSAWNKLPANVVNAPSLNAFKSRLDAHWSEQLYEFLD